MRGFEPRTLKICGLTDCQPLQFSATVAVSPTHLIAANAGDSRAVLALSSPVGTEEDQDLKNKMFKIRNGSYVVAHELTSDHKPGRCDEQQVGIGHSYTVIIVVAFFARGNLPQLQCNAGCPKPMRASAHTWMPFPPQADTMLDYSYARLTLCGPEDRGPGRIRSGVGCATCQRISCCVASARGCRPQDLRHRRS